MDEPASINGDSIDPMDTIDDCKPHVSFSITDAIRKSRNLGKGLSDSNNNYNKSEAGEATNGSESPVTDFNHLFHASADQNNNDSEVKKHLTEGSYRGASKSRNHQMQQLLQQHVFTPHQLQQLIVPPMTMSTPKDSLFHFEQKRKQMEILMHQIQEQLHANILQQTHLLQNQASSGEGGSGKKGSTFQLQQKLAMQQQELAQQFQLVQRQYLLHQSGMQLLFPHHQQQQQQLQSKSKNLILFQLIPQFKFDPLNLFSLSITFVTFLNMISLLMNALDVIVVFLSPIDRDTFFLLIIFLLLKCPSIFYHLLHPPPTLFIRCQL